MHNFNEDLNFIVLEIVTAISKMAQFNPSYYTELLSDSTEFNTRPATKNQLKEKFHGWRDKLETNVKALAALKTSSYYQSISMKRQLEMAYTQIQGEVEQLITDIYACKYCLAKEWILWQRSLVLAELISIVTLDQ